ncbi:hypothetical protein T440DRAFT_60845 [Plenodomus tracheiphilus IPT5]|uniref:Uncharacterized protein n=1 Tax=Plenodomus tracheiphilus IPT5 TaxID=1408161 RepID=A0A6A7AMX1_9PLEO|nr:hypothetical protein T440DRAFT_60845 [Plenodomus tracheiphilus IPT5]
MQAPGTNTGRENTVGGTHDLEGIRQKVQRQWMYLDALKTRQTADTESSVGLTELQGLPEIQRRIDLLPMYAGPGNLGPGNLGPGNLGPRNLRVLGI